MMTSDRCHPRAKTREKLRVKYERPPLVSILNAFDIFSIDVRNIVMKEVEVREKDAVSDKLGNVDIVEPERVVHWKVYLEKV